MLPIILAAKARGNEPDAIVVLLVGVALFGVIGVVAVAQSYFDVVMKGETPFCPRCDRRVWAWRIHCGSCGYQIRHFGKDANLLKTRDALAKIKIPTQADYWESLHQNPDDWSAKWHLRYAIKEELEKRLLGPKVIDEDVVKGAVILRRSRLQYESHVEPFAGHDRHGFIIMVPTHKLRIRITCPRVVPANVVGAPWDDLLENLCKTDRWVIKQRNSKSNPLTYVPRHGPHPMVKVEFLDPKALPNP